VCKVMSSASGIIGAEGRVATTVIVSQPKKSDPPGQLCKLCGEDGTTKKNCDYCKFWNISTEEEKTKYSLLKLRD